MNAVVTPELVPAEESLDGEVAAIVFRNEDTGFSIMRVDVAGHRDPITIVGTSMARVGEPLTATGTWKQHPSFGRQFAATNVVPRRPTSAAAIERYLASGVLKGIGPAMAKRIVQKFGEGTFAVLEAEPERLGEVQGIGPKRAEEVTKAWKESQAEREVLVFLAGHNILGALAHRIIRKYGGAAIEVVEKQPYRLAKEVRGVGFATADTIALGMGIPPESPERIEAGLRHVVSSSNGMGHCGMPREAFLTEAAKTLNLAKVIVRPVMDELLATREFMVPVILPPESQFVFDKRLYEAEAAIARALREMTTVPPWSVTEEKAAEIALDAEAACGVDLAPEQRMAVEMALLARASVLTGGPGTGKTSTLKVILAALRMVRARVLLGAPTGKAAKRMRESTGHEAATVARLIGMGRPPGDDEVEIECDILIIDESSMVDVLMLEKVLRCLEQGAALLFVGDVDQLPSVGPGRVLGDLIESGAVPTVRLTKIFRQAATSAIIRNAHRINQGQGIEPPGGEGTDFFFIEASEPEEIAARIRSLVQRHIPERIGILPQDVQVLSPMRKSATGTEALNALLQNSLNPAPAAKIEKFGRRFGVGDRVLQTVNNYELGVMNGESGLVRGVDVDGGLLRVQVDDLMVDYPFADLDQLDLAYAMTIHKSQGSQFPAVVIPVSTQHYVMLQRPIIYTGITRASRFCVLVGQRRALEIAIANTRMEPRITSLKIRLS